jgi:hypothetical protein
MSEQITLQVPDQIVRQAAQIAAHNQQSIEDVLTEWLTSAATEPPVELLSDEEVVILAKMKFTSDQQERFSDLLDRNREGELDAEGREELDLMMRIYERGLLRKAQALQEAVKRGLMELPRP